VSAAGRARPPQLRRAFYARPSVEVAPELLNKVLVLGACRGRIVEVEAYLGPDDPASHAHRGPTRRNATMFGPAGHLYVYFTYGMHWCANVVCGRPGEGTAVLLRALAPLEGLDAMRARRPAARRDRDLCNGPAKLAQALGIDGRLDGADLTARPGSGEVAAGPVVTIVDGGTPPPDDPVVTTRIGISRAIELPLRWYVRGEPHVSRR